MKRKNTIYKQKSELDQFYTNDKIAEFCYSQIIKLYNEKDFSLFLEPSAGTGSFLKLFPRSKRIGLDIDPKNNEILKQDFFNYCAPLNEKIITIGNPPFGRICSLAIKFFNEAAKFSSVIAFIIPKTFQKQSLQKKLNPFFKLKKNINLPQNSFVYGEAPYDVPCCFQIWEKSTTKRKFKKTDANFAIRRVGGRAGKASLEIDDLSESSHYFLKYKLKKDSLFNFIELLNRVDFSKISNSTAGVKSLSMPELISILKRKKIIK